MRDACRGRNGSLAAQVIGKTTLLLGKLQIRFFIDFEARAGRTTPEVAQLLLPLLEGFLLLSRVPLQRPRNAIDPICPPSCHWQNAWERESRCANRHVIARLELNSLSAVEACPRACSRIIWYPGAENNRVRQYNRSEGQRMRANSRDKNDRIVGVA